MEKIQSHNCYKHPVQILVAAKELKTTYCTLKDIKKIDVYISICFSTFP